MITIKLRGSFLVIEKSPYKEKNEAILELLKGFNVSQTIGGDYSITGSHEHLYQALLSLISTYDIKLE